MRGLVKGMKQSSSKPEGTIYLGSGHEKIEDVNERIGIALDKIDNAASNPETFDVDRFALDMVRFIEVFNNKSKVDFCELMINMPQNLKKKLNSELDDEKRTELFDNYLINECIKKQQKNVDIVKEHIGMALIEHQKRREEVFNYAIAKHNKKDVEKPRFWHVPNEGLVAENKREIETKWYDIVLENADKLII